MGSVTRNESEATARATIPTPRTPSGFGPGVGINSTSKNDNSMTAIFNDLTKIGELNKKVRAAEMAITAAEKKYEDAEIALNVAVDKLHDKIKDHPSKENINALLADILSEELDKGRDDAHTSETFIR